MRYLMAYVRLAVFRWLDGGERVVATVSGWYRRGRRLNAMLDVGRNSVRALDQTLWDAHARVRAVEECGRKLKGASDYFDLQADMLAEMGGLLVAHRMNRRSRDSFELATAAFVAALTAAEGALGRLGRVDHECETALNALGWLNARVAASAPHDLFRLLGKDIEAAGSFLKEARQRYARVPAELTELKSRLDVLKQAPFKA